LRILNLHGPLKSIKHFQQEKVLFLDIVTNFNPDPFSFSDFEAIDSLDFDPLPSTPTLSILIFSGQFKDASNLTLFLDILPLSPDECMFNLLQNQFEQKPLQLQASPTFDSQAKIRGVCFHGEKVL
jgi:hypothetical protein